MEMELHMKFHVREKLVEIYRVDSYDLSVFYNAISESKLLDKQFGKFTTFQEFNNYMKDVDSVYVAYVAGDFSSLIYIKDIDRHSAYIHFCLLKHTRVYLDGAKDFFSTLKYKNLFIYFNSNNKFIDKTTDYLGFKDRILLENFDEGQDFIQKRYINYA